MQKVELYDAALEAKRAMEQNIQNGWRVQACTMNAFEVGFSHGAEVLVVYEKDRR